MRPSFHRIIRVDRMMQNENGEWILEQLREKHPETVLYRCIAPIGIMYKCGSLVEMEMADGYSRFGRLVRTVQYESMNDVLSMESS